MYITIRRQTLRNTVTGGILLGAAGVLLGYPAAMTTGISRGLAVCSRVILPTLYPFMLLAGITANSALCRYPGRTIQWLTRRLFGLPGCCGPAILLSLVGGYPAGMMAVAGLYRQGQIREPEVKRMSAFCIGGGPGFIVTTVGVGMLGNPTAGWLLFAAQAITSLGFGILLGRGQKREKENTPAATEPLPFSRIVGNTCGALLSMCGFVVAASLVLSLAEGTGLCRTVAAWMGLSAVHLSAGLAAVLEVSCGCLALAKATPLMPLLLSLCLSWGGLSVQGQLAAILPECRVITPRFWMWRIIHGWVSGVLAILLFRLCPPAQTTATITGSTIPYSVSATATGMLIFLSFLAMLQFSEKKTGNLS